MLTAAHAPASHALFEGEPDNAEAQRHLDEVVRCLPPDYVRALMIDIDGYDQDGAVGEVLSDVLRRAACLADADRISARLATA